MLISRYFVWFVIYSCMGWLFETTYCTLKEGKWMNRGFLYGPVCPIYGVGAVAVSILIEQLPKESAETMTWWQLFLIGYFGSIVLEYVTSWALEVLFHAKWWDYSDMPFNIKGRICVPASILFGVGAIFVVRVLYPFMGNMTGGFHPLAMETASLLFMAVMAGDAALTVSELTGFDKQLQNMELMVNRHMEGFVTTLEEKKQDAQLLMAEEKNRFSKENVEHMLEYMTHGRVAAVQRVKTFTAQPSEKLVTQKNRVLAMIKRTVNREKKDLHSQE